MRTLLRSALLTASAVLAVNVTELPAQPNVASLSIARIYHDGPLAAGVKSTFRVTVRNGNQRVPTPSREPVIVTLTVRDPNQKLTTHQATIAGGVGANGSQNVAIPDVPIYMRGTYTVTAFAEVPPQSGRAPIRSPDRTETFAVGAAVNSALGGEAPTPSFDLTVTLTNARGLAANGLRVSLSTPDGQEIGWKNSSGNGEARFPALAPSPANKPYKLVVRRGAQVVASQDVLMPARANSVALSVP
jgi:hypothetical protein